MKTIAIVETDDFLVESVGNGWAYRFENRKTYRDIWLQDDDATAFRYGLEALAHETYADACRYLWDHVYGEVADLIASEA